MESAELHLAVLFRFDGDGLFWCSKTNEARWDVNMWWVSIVGTAATFGQQHLTTYADIDLVALFLNKSIQLRGHLREI